LVEKTCYVIEFFYHFSTTFSIPCRLLKSSEKEEAVKIEYVAVVE